MALNRNSIKWKRLHVDDPTLTSQGLIAVEECTEYDTVNVSKHSENCKRKNAKKTKPSKKAKNLYFLESKSLTPSISGSSFQTNVEAHTNPDVLQELGKWNHFGLPDCLIKAIVLQGFTTPTLIQSLTLPAAILGRRDIIGAAETGSGKTLAFGLPILSGILEQKSKVSEVHKRKLYALILTPTRELAIQIKNHLSNAAKFTDIDVAVLVGGIAVVKQERILNKRPEIVVATPGRLWELIQGGNEHLSQANFISYLAIDETDRMLEKGHFEELHSLLEKLNSDRIISSKRQNFVFSATLTLVHDLPKYAANKSKCAKMTSQRKLQTIIDTLGITNPKIVDITQQGTTPETLTESRISCQFDEKDYYVYYFLQKHLGKTLIFCNSIGCVKRLSNLLTILGYSPLPLHASMQQRQRLKNLEKFRDEENGVLIATDVAARGLDIPHIQHVVHYQIPRTSETYIHRSGRTARAFRKGLTVLFMEPSEIQIYTKLCKTLNKSEDLPLFPIQEHYLKAVKDRVNLARELDKLELEIRKGNSEEGWLRKASREMDIIADDFPRKYDNDDVALKQKLATSKRKRLRTLLTKPVFAKGFSGQYPLYMKHLSECRSEIVEDSISTVLNTKSKRKQIPLFKSSKKKTLKNNMM